MAKKSRKSRIPPAASKSSDKKSPAEGAEPFTQQETFRVTRELAESIVIAFVLAFLFRTFQAEAFVIPTGSMANTLVGRHKDVDCPKCGQRYRAGASSELDNESGESKESPIVSTQCPNCGYVANVQEGNSDGVRSKSYNGDRILVGKFAYESGLGQPQRWDVAVFKFPGRATINYIKRLVGLPNEELLIKNGDVYVQAEGAADFQIARKSHNKVRAMMQPVHDSDHMPRELYAAGWPARWESDNTGTRWTSTDDRHYKTAGPAVEPAWLRYRHRLPGKAQWVQLKKNPDHRFTRDDARAFLITDANAYNSSLAQHNFGDEYEPHGDNKDIPHSSLGMNWVSDLVLDSELRVIAAEGQAVFELVDSGRQLRCTFDLLTGRATLSISGMKDFAPTAETQVKGVGKHSISFANVDNKLFLWVDGSPVEFDQPTEYPSLGDHIPTEADLAPVAIGATGGADLEVSCMKIYRDIYYIAMKKQSRRMQDDADSWRMYDDVDYASTIDDTTTRPRSRAEFFSNPEFWRDQPSQHALPHKNTDVFRNARTRKFEIGEDKFFMLGDNSARSQDGRLWTVTDRGEVPDMGHTVDRKQMIGKALFIYWPASFDEIPGTRIWMPFFPNFGDMKLVR